MSKWCGDENCLQCLDKEPDPYVHLPREEYQTLRDERDRLREALEKIVAGIDHYGADHILRKQYLADDDWWSLKRGDHSFPLWIAWMALKQAALTPATPPLTPNEATE